MSNPIPNVSVYHVRFVFQAQIYNKDKGSRISVFRLPNRYYTDKSVQCRNCNKTGHLSKNCPEPKVSPSALQMFSKDILILVKLLTVCSCVLLCAEIVVLLSMWHSRPPGEPVSQQALQQLWPARALLWLLQRAGLLAQTVPPLQHDGTLFWRKYSILFIYANAAQCQNGLAKKCSCLSSLTKSWALICCCNSPKYSGKDFISV